MSRGGTFASIDVGTTKICTVVGEVASEGEMRILGVGIAPSAGLSRGMVENIRDATDSIKASVEKAERSSGTRILSAHVGVAGTHIACLNNRGIVAIPDRTRPIMPDDVTRVLDGARVVSIPTNREIIHVIPRYYVVDGQDNVSDPVGMFGSRLDVETHIVTGVDATIQNLTKCVENVGVQVDGLILEPLGQRRGGARRGGEGAGRRAGRHRRRHDRHRALHRRQRLPHRGAAGRRQPHHARHRRRAARALPGGGGGEAEVGARDPKHGGRARGDHDRGVRLRGLEDGAAAPPLRDRPGAHGGDPRDGDGRGEARRARRHHLGRHRAHGRQRASSPASICWRSR